MFLTENRLSIAEEELARANLSQRLDLLNEVKIVQNHLIKSYQSDLLLLEAEVSNIRAIAHSLPEGCFKRTRLEP